MKAVYKNLPTHSYEGGRNLGRGVPVYTGPRNAFFCYQPDPFTFVPQTSNYFGLANYKHVAMVLGQYSQVILPREVLFNSGLTWTNGSTNENDIVYDWSASVGTRWKNIIAEVRVQQARLPLAMRTRFYCYIPLGQRAATDYELTQAEIDKALSEGIDPANLGADGAFFDECGYDYQVHRETRQNYAVDECRTYAAANTNRGCVMMNAWFPGDVLATVFNASYNPNTTAPTFGGTSQVGGGDCFMAESLPVNTSTATAQYLQNYHTQNFRFTVASNGVQGINERVQAIQTGRSARDVSLTMLSFIEQSPNAVFYELHTQLLSVILSAEHLAISRTDSFEDFQPRTPVYFPWVDKLGSQGFYNPQRTLTVLTNGGGSTISGYSAEFEKGTVAFGEDPTLGLHESYGPGFHFMPGMAPPFDRSHTIQPVDFVLTSGDDDDLEDPPDTNLGFARGLIPAIQGGGTLAVGHRVLSLSGANAGVWCVIGTYTYDPGPGTAEYAFCVRSGDMYSGTWNLSGAKIAVTQGRYAGTTYRIANINPFSVLGEDLVIVPDGEIVLNEDLTVTAGNGAGGVATTMQAPADSQILGASYRVTQAPGGGATTFEFGPTGGDLDALADNVSTALNTTGSSVADGESSAVFPLRQAAAATFTLTTDANVTGASMIVRFVVRVRAYTAPA